MRKYIKILIVLSTIFMSIHLRYTNIFADTTKEINYERDYLSRIYDSENGLEGTTANCVCPSDDGFLWFGGYTGLYRYDGSEFKKYTFNGRALPVNDIVQDKAGNLWVGTNGDGVYRFDGKNFKEYTLNNEEGSSVINKLYLDKKGIVWIGTKAGLFSVNTMKSNSKAREYDTFSNSLIEDIGELSDGKKVIIDKTGDVYLLKNNEFEKLKIPGMDEKNIPRCISAGNEDCFYIGTAENEILKMSNTGEVETKIKGNGLSSFNEIYKMQKGKYWICSDTGIGILENDNVKRLQFPFDDSVEEGCEDYQGNLWFVSSREGVLQIYKNHFSDLGSYWNLKETTNSVQPYDDKIYVGCDTGLYCYRDREQVEDELVKACKGERIRQIYKDNEKNLWVSTYQDGIKVLRTDGTVNSYNTDNSGLQTNKIRCIWEMADKEILVGTEDGLYVIDQNNTVRNLVENEILNTKRILDAKEDYKGRIFVSTDGYGIYEIENGRVEKVYSKRQGLLSNVVMKIVPSKNMDGIWVVTGEGICFIDKDGKIRRVTGISVANSLDFLISDDGQAVVLAGNGFFQLKEKDLLKKGKVSYIHYDKRDGLPVDFTANARNSIQNGILYMCGTTGTVSISLNEKHVEKTVKLYVNEVTEDGNNVEIKKKGIVISSKAHRINIDIKPIDYVHQNLYMGYCLSGTDKKQTKEKDEDIAAVSYTNLSGGSYRYHFKVYDAENDKCLAKLSVPVQKNYKYNEEPRVKILLVLLELGVLILIFILLAGLREKRLEKHYQMKYWKEKEEEVSKLAYKDLVTDVYNRNFFEKEKNEIDVRQLYALLSVSINYVEYFKGKYGIFYTENILRKGVQVIQKCTKEDVKICRVSENIFYFWLMEPVQLESYIQELKETFRKQGEEEGMPLSFSVGAIYNNTVGKENIDELIDRCGKMRLLDEKHAEAEFIEGKMKML